MATAYKCPVCIWTSHQGKITARLIDDFEEGIAVGETKKEAMEQLREYLVHRSKRDDFFWLDPDFEEPEIRQVRVRVVPEYHDDTRRFPCKEPILLKLPCAVGRRSTGLWAAFFPTLDLYFDFYDKGRFNELANHYAKHTLSELTPRELSRFLPPATCDIDYLNVTLKEQAIRFDEGHDTPNLQQVADPIGKRTLGRISRAWERDREVADLAKTLQEEGTNVCLVGASGCGKTSALVEAARKIGRDQDEKSAPPRFWMTGAARLIAGMRFLGQWEERCEAAIREITNLRGVLCVENLLDLLNVGGSGPESSVGAFLVPYLKSGELRVVAEATPQEIEACDRLLPGLIDEMQILKIEPFDPRAAMSVLGQAAEYFTQNERILFARSVSDEVYHLFRRFMPYVAFPGKAIQLMSSVVDHKVQEKGADSVELNDVRHEFSAQTGLPDLFLREDLPLRFEDLVETFSASLLGQDEAVRQVSRTIAKFKAGMNDPARPIGVMLFAGPTGVGKTQMVKLIGDFLFSHKPAKDRLVRLDMSEYSGHDAAERLLGNVMGRPSELVQKIRANPFSVVLLDEIEKASNEVFDVLMNVFDEGRLTDPLGRETAFNSTIIVMTSNLGATTSGDLGFGTGAADEETPPTRTDPAKVRDFFRPEFFNRIDHVVFFNALGKSTILAITKLELAQIARREGFVDRGLKLEFSDALIAAVSNAGFDPVYGARPLQRAVEEKVVMPLSRLLVEQPKFTKQALQLDWDVEAQEMRIEAEG